MEARTRAGRPPGGRRRPRLIVSPVASHPKALASIDPLAVPLRRGTEVTTRVGRVSGELFATLARAGLGPSPSEDDGLAVMILLHTHRARLGDSAPSGRPGVLELAAITQRHAAELIAAAWLDRSDTARTVHATWYWAFNTQTPFEVSEEVPSAWAARVTRAREALLRTSLVADLVPED